jgi:hypothetical protein
MESEQLKTFLMQEEIDAINNVSEELHKLFNTWKHSLIKTITEETPFLKISVNGQTAMKTQTLRMFSINVGTRISSITINSFNNYDNEIVEKYKKMFEVIYYSEEGINKRKFVGPTLQITDINNKDLTVIFGTQTGGYLPFSTNIELFPKKSIKFNQIKKYLRNFYIKLFEFYFVENHKTILPISFSEEYLNYRKDAIKLNHLKQKLPELEGIF